MNQLTNIPTLADIEMAHKAIAPYIHHTPVLSSQGLNEIAGCSLFFKCENLQKVGAFKMRGASCAVMALTTEEKARGIATHSSGNHAQAVALAAKLNGIPAHIVMPKNAPSIKRAAVEGYGATVYTSGNTITEREGLLEEVLQKTNATFIHPYNNYNVIAGQATAAKELHETITDLQVIIAPIGGGGLMSGTALYTHYAHPTVKILGAEPKNVDDAFRSLQSGKMETNDTIDTIADGLRTALGDKTFPIIMQHVEEIITVSEAEIVAAMQLIWERLKVVVEPSGAVPFAAILQQKERFKGKRIGVVFSGGNVDLTQLPF